MAWEFVNAYRDAGLPMPPTNRAFGGVFIRAIKRKMITQVDWGPSPTSHAAKKPVYLWNPFYG